MVVRLFPMQYGSRQQNHSAGEWENGTMMAIKIIAYAEER
jgi:hypothetical protein